MRSARSEIADSYDALIQKGYFSDRFGGNEGYLGRLLTHYVPDDAQSILEVGAGTGRWMAQMLKKKPAMRDVTIVEISSGAKECSNRIGSLLAPRKGNRLRVIQADFLDVAGTLGTADIVATGFTSEYMGTPAGFVEKLYGLTAPGGRVILTDILTSAKDPAGTISPRLVVRSFFNICGAYIRRGLFPPLYGVVRSLPLYRFVNEPAFRRLYEEYSSRYSFPREAWVEIAKEYPASRFHDLGMAGLLVINKPT